MANEYLNWPEIGIFGILVISMILAMSVIQSLFLYLIVIFLFGAMFGREWAKGKKSQQTILVIITTVFFLGYGAASIFLGYGSFISALGLYLLGIWIGYMVHEKNVIKSI